MTLLQRTVLITLAFTAGCKKNPPVTAAPAPPTNVIAQRAAAAGDGLQVFVNGKPTTGWTQDRLATVTPVTLKNHSGDDRMAWALRDVTKSLVGESARVVGLVNDDHERVTIPPNDWNDASRTLVMRPSHRGGYKVQWMDAQGSSGDALLKQVRRLDIVQ